MKEEEKRRIHEEGKSERRNRKRRWDVRKRKVKEK